MGTKQLGSFGLIVAVFNLPTQWKHEVGEKDQCLEVLIWKGYSFD
jgi:hypothetical protein